MNAPQSNPPRRVVSQDEFRQALWQAIQVPSAQAHLQKLDQAKQTKTA